MAFASPVARVTLTISRGTFVRCAGVMSIVGSVTAGGVDAVGFVVEGFDALGLGPGGCGSGGTTGAIGVAFAEAARAIVSNMTSAPTV